MAIRPLYYTIVTKTCPKCLDKVQALGKDQVICDFCSELFGEVIEYRHLPGPPPSGGSSVTLSDYLRDK